MIPSERQQQILDLVAEKGVISITALIEKFNVSHMTIRRDIQKLEKTGAIVSVSGGIQTLERLPFEPSHSNKALMSEYEKERISQCAAEHILHGSSIYLDAGTTSLALAKNIAHRSDLIIITNDFVIAAFLIEHSACKLIHTGGVVCRENSSCVGTFAAKILLNTYVDIAFISTSSWSLKGLTTPDEDKIAVKEAIINSSGKRILITDSSKYGKVATFFIAPLTVFDLIITDNKLSEHAIKTIKERNLAIQIAK
ncbi:DeoR family transcriptional regulator [Orbus mooreae]|uniref:DeoR family transcriptional regulator n=1 Tax=Orbus mooreae TaxID=3074107 RepID=UPI00370CFCCE